MLNELKSKNEILFNIHVYNGRVVNDDYSNMDSVAAVYGLALISKKRDTLKDANLLVYVDIYAAIGIVNLDTGEEDWYWGKDEILDDRSSILLYVLTDDFEWLIYRSQELKQGFHLAAIPKKHPAREEIVKRVDSLEFYKAYEGMADMMCAVNHINPYKRLLEYVILADDVRDKRLAMD